MSRGWLTSACSSNRVRVLVGPAQSQFAGSSNRASKGMRRSLVREFRSARAIETNEQETVVREFYGT